MYEENKKLEKTWRQVPVDYYQKGVKNNLFQRLWHRNKLRATIDLLKDAKIEPKKILDVGCASGWFLSEVAKVNPQAKCTGLDVYKEAIDYANQSYPFINFIESDAHQLPLPENSYDLVLCDEVLEHVLHPERVIAEIKRVVSPKGFALIEMDTGNLLFRLIWYFWTNINHGVWKNAHLHIFNTGKLERMITNDELKIVKKKFFNLGMAVVFLLKK